MKVVYNACYGGFVLSKEAVELGRRLSGNASWNGACISGDKYNDGTVVSYDYGGLDDSICRHDEVLVNVVEILGENASGQCSNLEIKEIPDGAEYEITCYDGYEGVEPPRMTW